MKQPLRKCVGCGEMIAKKDLIRIVKSPAGNLEIDLLHKKNGRGAYLCSKEECYQKAIKKKGLERSFQQAIPKEAYENLGQELKKRC